MTGRRAGGSLCPAGPNGMSDIEVQRFSQGPGDLGKLGPDGSARAAEYVGEGELSSWFGGPQTVIVIYPDTREGEAVEVDRIIPRDD